MHGLATHNVEIFQLHVDLHFVDTGSDAVTDGDVDQPQVGSCAPHHDAMLVAIV